MRHLPWLALATLTLFASPLHAAQLVHGPAIVGTTATSAYISWETASSQSGAAIAWGTAPGQHPNQVVDSHNSAKHAVHLTGLAPRQTIYFTVDSDPSAQESSFTTPASGAQSGPLKFIVYGDNRTDTSDHQTVVDAIAAESDIAFLLQTGDMAQNYPFGISGGDEWDTFFSVEHDLLRTHPLFPTIGNHETLDALAHWSEFFSPPGFSNTAAVHYYSADWSQVHLAVMDAFETTLPDVNAADSISDAQLEWLKSDLDDAKLRGQVSFVSIHHGPYSHATGSSAHGGSALVLSAVVPELVSRGVVAIFSGHDHLYERGCNGDIDYLIAGGGGAPLYPVDANGPGVLAAQSALSYAVITVDGKSVTGVGKRADGSAIDTFALPTSGCSHAAAIDGGSADAGGDDGGPNDAGLDAGAVDAGEQDAGLPDAGEADAGNDAGAADAGQPGSDAGAGGDGSVSSSCASFGVEPWLLAPLLAFALRNRRRTGARNVD